MAYPVAYRRNASSSARGYGSQSAPVGRTAFRPENSAGPSRLPTPANSNLPRPANTNLPKRLFPDAPPFGKRLPVAAGALAARKIPLALLARLGGRVIPVLGWALLAYDLYQMIAGLTAYKSGLWVIGAEWTKTNACPDIGSPTPGVKHGPLGTCNFNGNTNTNHLANNTYIQTMFFTHMTKPGQFGLTYHYVDNAQYSRAAGFLVPNVAPKVWPYAPQFPLPMPAGLPTPNYPINPVNPWPSLNPVGMPVDAPAPAPAPLPNFIVGTVTSPQSIVANPFIGTTAVDEITGPVTPWPYAPPGIPVPGDYFDHTPAEPIPLPETLPRVTITPDGPPKVEDVFHVNEPPGPKTKERKAIVAAKGTVLAWYNALSEVDDFVDALYWAIVIPRNRQDDIFDWKTNRWIRRGRDLKYRRPGATFWKDKDGKWHSRKSGPGLGEKIEFVYKHYKDLDLELATKNIIKNEIGDRFWGRVGKAQREGAQNVFDKGLGNPSTSYNVTRHWW